VVQLRPRLLAAPPITRRTVDEALLSTSLQCEQWHDRKRVRDALRQMGLPCRGVLHYAPHIRPQPVNQPNELVSAACFMNDSSAASCCFGGCSGHGRCSRGLCVCAPGWRGLDCAEYASTTDGASSIDSGCAAPGFVYVFDPPPSLGLEHMARRQYLGSLYDNEPHFLRKLLAAKCVRTTDPARARLFYVPTFAYALWGNVANDLHEKRTMGRLAAWLHNQPAFRGLLHSTRRTVAWPLHCRA